MTRIPERHICPECSYIFDSWAQMRMHLHYHHPESPVPVPEIPKRPTGCGTRWRYQMGCRCDECRRAVRNYRRLVRARAHNGRVAQKSSEMPSGLSAVGRTLGASA